VLHVERFDVPLGIGQVGIDVVPLERSREGEVLSREEMPPDVVRVVEIAGDDADLVLVPVRREIPAQLGIMGNFLPAPK
jgi:hypothetical protein